MRSEELRQRVSLRTSAHTQNPCHCETVRTLSWQSVFLPPLSGEGDREAVEGLAGNLLKFERKPLSRFAPAPLLGEPRGRGFPRSLRSLGMTRPLALRESAGCFSCLVSEKVIHRSPQLIHRVFPKSVCVGCFSGAAGRLLVIALPFLIHITIFFLFFFLLLGSVRMRPYATAVRPYREMTKPEKLRCGNPFLPPAAFA